jgi:hypothetical protein
MDWIEMKIWRRVLELGIHRSVGPPAHVLIRLRQTECAAGGFSSSVGSVVEGAVTHLCHQRRDWG